MREFYGCYLLSSLNPKAKGRTYIGFTVNPRRRIRQHNGEICSGASKTKGLRPWEMVLVVYGFPSQTQALQFEWSWQHPEKSLDIRGVAARLGRKARYGMQGKILLLMEMLRTEPWCYYPLTLQFLSSKASAERGRCPAPPPHMTVLVAPLEALPEVVDDVVDPAEEAENDNDSDEEEGDIGGDSDAGEGAGVGQGRGAQGAVSCEWEDPGDLLDAAPEAFLEPYHGGSWEGTSGGGGSASQSADGELGGDPVVPAAAAAAVTVAGAKGRKGKGARGAGGAAVSKAAAARALSACTLCGKAASRTWHACRGCGARCHVECLARSLLEAEASGASIPTRGQCPGCSRPLVWMEALSSLQNAGWERHKGPKAKGTKAGSGAAAAAAGAGVEGGSAPGSPSGKAAAGAGGRKKKGRGPKKAAGLDGEGELSGPGGAAAGDAGAAAAAGRGSKPRGRKGAAAAAVPLRDEGGEGAVGGAGALRAESSMAGSVARVAGEAPAKRKGRPRKAAGAALPPGGAAAPATGTHAATGPLPPQRRRRQGQQPSAQPQPARHLWEAAGELQVQEAAPWDDFGMGMGNEFGISPGGSPSPPSLAANSPPPWGLHYAAAAAAAAWHCGGGDGAGPSQQAQQHRASPSVVVLSDSGSEGDAEGPSLPLAQRLLLHQRRRAQQGAGRQHAHQPVADTAPALPDTHVPQHHHHHHHHHQQPTLGEWGGGAAVSHSPSQSPSPAVAGLHWDSPPTHRLGSFRLTSPTPSPPTAPLPASHPSQHQQGHPLYPASPMATSPLEGATLRSQVGHAQHAAGTAGVPAAVRAFRQEEGEVIELLEGQRSSSLPSLSHRPQHQHHQQQLAHPSHHLLLHNNPESQAQAQLPLGSPQHDKPGHQPPPTHQHQVRQQGHESSQHQSQWQQQQHEGQQQRHGGQQQVLGLQPVEVIELVSPSPLPLWERLRRAAHAPLQPQQQQQLEASHGLAGGHPHNQQHQQGPDPSGSAVQSPPATGTTASHAHPGQALLRDPPGGAHGGSPPGQAGLRSANGRAGGGLPAAAPAAAAAAVGGEGAGQQAAAGGQAPAGGLRQPGGEAAAAKPKRQRAYARSRRPQPKPPSPSLGVSHPPAKSRGPLASPRGTPSPAPLRKRMQQQYWQEEGSGVGGGAVRQPALGGSQRWGEHAPVSRDVASGSGQQQQQQHMSAGSEDDVIVISD